MTNWSSIFHSSISLPFSIRRLCNHHEQVSLPSKTGEGDVFFAIKGSRCDGHQFIPEAIKRGAGAIVCEKHPESCGDNQVPHIIVADGAAAWTDANRCQWGNPDHHLKIYGVTGTAGKTTITHAIQQILGHSCGRIGTIDCQWGEHCIASSQTTPRAEYMFQILREMVDDG
ncbi:MAG: Mur ligase domain-containing protein, partial [Puniceicoccales bacterium]|nr:Mur ligase domain-containing protein [Puniceicoccales bacterium]